MELRFWVVSLILFSGIFALMIIAFHDAAIGYGAEDLTNSQIEERYNRLEEQKELVGSLQETTSGEEGLKVLNVLGTVFTATIGVLSLVLNSISFIPSVFACSSDNPGVGCFASDFGIPTEVTSVFFVIISLIIVTLIIFAILNAIKR